MKTNAFASVAIILFLIGCNPSANTIPCEYAKTQIVEVPVCGEFQCGVATNVKHHLDINCGQCENHPGYVCGDNGRQNICGKDCQGQKRSGLCLKYSPYFTTQYAITCDTINKERCVDVDLYMETPSDVSKIRCCNFSGNEFTKYPEDEPAP